MRIHGGAHEIGGNCVELRHGHGTLILDIGKPLTAGFDTVVPLPAAIGLGDNGTGPLGVIISHGHQDHWVPFTLGPFTITPYLADHSAYDAFSLLIQAGGRSLFYTGDIRGHGRKASAFEQLLAEPPSPVNAILMEGTSFRASDPDVDAEAGASELAPEVSPEYVTLRESDVEVELADTLKATSGLVVVLASAQNIDRLVT